MMNDDRENKSTFLEETQRAISKSGHTPADIVYIGSSKSAHACTWAEFRVLAHRKDYEAPTSLAQVVRDLVIVFEDGQQMWREVVQGGHRSKWAYATPFDVPSETREIETLFSEPPCEHHTTLKEIHDCHE